ncbi:MAG: YbaN family protein [Alphaproteobacteria bacterium]|nr:YbaN family protein [Alphaproteobacteria bacterium]
MKPGSLHRPLFFVLGLVFVGLGLLGVVLPVLPTTPFMIVALWCFARSSERFHAWLFHHRLFGPPLRKWDQHRVIPVVAKIAAVSGMVASLIYVVLFSSAPWQGMAAMASFMAVVAWYILSKPSHVPGVPPVTHVSGVPPVTTERRDSRSGGDTDGWERRAD